MAEQPVIGQDIPDTRRKDTREYCAVRGVEKCCETCQHFGFHPDGCGECAMLLDYEDGKPYIGQTFDPDTQSLVPCESHPMVGCSNICDAWEKKVYNQEERA